MYACYKYTFPISFIMTSHDLLLGQGFPSFYNAFHFYIRVNHSATMYICVFDMIAIALDHLGIVWFLDLQLHMQSVPITTKVVSSNLCHSEMY